VKAVVTLEGEPSDALLEAVSLPTLEPALEVVEDLPLGYMSGALYESIFVVEISSIGAEIFWFRMVLKECLVVKLLWGTLTETSGVLGLRFTEKARESEVDIFAERPGSRVLPLITVYGSYSPKPTRR